jgi:hypothetical protein
MKIVIDIPDYNLNDIQNGSIACGRILKAVKNGTPLPKGHGRLGDLDALDVTTIITDDYSGNEMLDVVLKEDIDNAPTIIEADREAERD